jgi:hypothetical protein
VSSIVGNSTENKKIKYPDLISNFTKDIVGDDPAKAVTNAESILSNKSAIAAGGKSLFNTANTTLEDKSEAPENQDTATKDFNEGLKNIAAEAKSAETGDTEDGVEEVKKLANITEAFHPSLQKFIEEIDEGDLYDWARDKHEGGDLSSETFELIQDYIDSCKKEDTTDTNKDMKYENKDYLDIPEEVKAEVMKDILDLLSKKESDIENKIKQMYELSDSDAEEFFVQGMELYLKNSDVEPKNSIKDIDMEEIEKSFEDSIDNYKGKDENMLDYLADTYEIDSDEAERIVEKTNGNLTETIYAFMDIVKNKLRE